MEKYIAFLRGINISGKNKIAMKELKEGFVSLGFYDVKTYLNSGNVLYSADRDDRKIIEDMIKEKFFLDIPVYTISFQRLKEILDMYEHKNSKTEVFTQTSLFELTEEEIDKNVEKPSFVEEELKNIRPLEMTPMEALSFLYNLKQKMKESSK